MWIVSGKWERDRAMARDSLILPRPDGRKHAPTTASFQIPNFSPRVTDMGTRRTSWSWISGCLEEQLGGTAYRRSYG